MRPQLRGAVCGLLAAALFGVSAPLAKTLLTATSPVVLAGLLYLGAGCGLALYRAMRPATSEAGLRRSDSGTVTLVTGLGGVLGPLLLFIGLRRVTAIVGSLMLNLEAPFTAAVAVFAFGEHLGRRAATALGLVVAGAAMLQLQPSELGGDLVGAVAVAGACACWAVDNNLTQRLSLRDPFAIVRVKALGAGAFNLALAVALGEHFPSAGTTALALLLGFLSYGVSIVLDAYALRLVGAAREAAYFATAPFLGVVVAAVFLNEKLSAFDFGAMLMMAAGVAVLLRERHTHLHAHEEIEHDHVHVHDEHHRHAHPFDIRAAEPHSHPHRHVALVHDHPHVPDLHHRHEH